MFRLAFICLVAAILFAILGFLIGEFFYTIAKVSAVLFAISLLLGLIKGLFGF